MTKKGSIFSEEHRKNLSISHLGQKAWNKGKKLSKEQINKIRISRLGTKNPWSEEAKLNFRKLMCGSNNPKWVSDRSKLQKYNDNDKDRRSSSYNFWRKQVWERDQWICKLKSKECSGRLETHHILCWKEYPELRYDVNNGITLCHAHHPRVRAEEKRLIPYFQRLVSVSKT